MFLKTFHIYQSSKIKYHTCEFYSQLSYNWKSILGFIFSACCSGHFIGSCFLIDVIRLSAVYKFMNELLDISARVFYSSNGAGEFNTANKLASLFLSWRKDAYIIDLHALMQQQILEMGSSPCNLIKVELKLTVKILEPTTWRSKSSSFDFVLYLFLHSLN